MRRTKYRRDERGVALLLTIFGLLLLTAVAAAMLYSSNSETMISVNYRDKEAATYAAVSGLQEARTRINPAYVSEDPTFASKIPTALPTASNGQVLYIVNPGPGETVASIAPWQATIGGKPNPYFDNELCQENVLGLSGTPGVACATVPSGSSWYSVYDNSANTTNWKLQDAGGNPIPLDYKWVRVTLKADNNAPVYIQNNNPADGTTQVCWDGQRYQIQKPATAGTDCHGISPGSPVASVNLITGGTGYSHANPPTVTFVGGGGSGAAATVQLHTNPGGISSTTVNPHGSGYTSPPTVTVVNPDGTGAAFQALVNGAPVTALSVAITNYCYPLGTTAGTVNFTPSNPGTGSSATATVTMTGQACISSASATASCGKSMKNQPLAITSVPGGSGGGFSGTITLDNKGAASNAAVSITNVGSYTSVPNGTQTVTVSGCPVSISYSGGIQASVSLTSGGEYLSKPIAAISGMNPPSAPTATQPTLNVTWSSSGTPTFGQLKQIQVTTPGTGYSNSSYALNISGGGGSGAVATATATSTTVISGLTLTAGGSGYTSVPQVVITDSPANIPAGSGASGTATLVGGMPPINYGAVYMLTSLAVTRNGSGTRAMVQMEAGVRPPEAFKFPGAVTLAGPSPTFGSPNSNNFVINGNDANSCGQTAYAPLPAIGVYDDPNNPPPPGTPTAQNAVTNLLGKPNNYIGAQSAPDVQNVFDSIGSDPSQITAEVDDISSTSGTTKLTGPLTSLPNMGTATNPISTVVNGDLTLSGSPSGYGVLVVTGNLTLNGNFTWHGVILVVGDAVVNNQGGGNGQITGAMYVANTNAKDANGNPILGSPTFNWNGGGGNGIQYDHCWADNLINHYPPKPVNKQLQVLSSRMLQF